ncbi:hypothetical protein AK812_SmicGene44073 [Symbiodinium microadriaticum]|uniref:Uncharacterized protein n=1 Tax=Symbiodinium microadriaticum TaxID=2951 RepID=A0A1Q9BZD8_SYMMI|nr:hypothetical protein AK812_SmicGene44073 [Symbiodinium microadriaticum]
MLEWLEYDFNNFPVDRLRLWRDAYGNTFEPELALPIAFNRVDQWYWAVLRARHFGRVTPSAVPLSVPSHASANDLVVIDYTNLTWFLRGWREWRFKALARAAERPSSRGRTPRFHALQANRGGSHDQVILMLSFDTKAVTLRDMVLMAHRDLPVEQRRD